MTTDTPIVVEQVVQTTSGASHVQDLKSAATSTSNVDIADNLPAEKEPSEEELKALEGLDDLKNQGTRAFAVADYADAVEKFSLASELLSKVYGQLSPKCADILYMYGRALYRNAVANSSFLSENTTTNDSGKVEDDAIESAATVEEKKKSGRFAFKDVSESTKTTTGGDAGEIAAAEDAAQDLEEDNDDEEDGEDKDDLETAWVVLETARSIYSRITGDAAKLQLAETYLVLGEVSLESESFDQAVKDFRSALEAFSSVLPEADRKVAQAHYCLANALENTLGAVEAVRHVEAAIDVLKKRIQTIEKSSDTESPEEIKEMQQLIKEMELRVEDLKSSESKNIPKNDEEMIAGIPVDTAVNDLSALVKSKKSDAAKFIEEALGRSSANGQNLKRKADDASGEDAKKLKEEATA